MESQITGATAKNGLVQSRIINKLKAEYDDIHLEREQKIERLAQLDTKRNQQEETLNDLRYIYNSPMTKAYMQELADAFKDLSKTNNKNSSALKLANTLEQSKRRHERLDELRANLAPALSISEKAFIDSRLTGTVDRNDYQSLINDLANLQIKHKAIKGNEHVVEDLKEMTRLIRDDRASYHEELVLFGNTIVSEFDTNSDGSSIQDLFNDLHGWSLYKF